MMIEACSFMCVVVWLCSVVLWCQLSVRLAVGFDEQERQGLVGCDCHCRNCHCSISVVHPAVGKHSDASSMWQMGGFLPLCAVRRQRAVQFGISWALGVCVEATVLRPQCCMDWAVQRVIVALVLSSRSVRSTAMQQQCFCVCSGSFRQAA